MNIKNLPFLLATVLFAAPHLCAQPKIFTIDPAASTVNFSLGDVMHSVHGTFHVQSGSVEFDTTIAKIGGSIVVAAGSGRSGNDTRDRKMAAEILDAPHFADVSFVPKTFQGTISAAGDSTVQVTGTFTLHGTAHDLTVPMQIHIDGAACTAKTHFSVPYVQWGLKDPSTFVLRVAKAVEIDLTLAGSIASRN